jgi:hypothetical protein
MANEPRIVINYKGHTIKSKYYMPLSDKQFKELQVRHNYKPPLSEVKDEIIKLFNGGSQVAKIRQYFFADLMYKVKVWDSPYTVEDVFTHKPLAELFAGKTQENDKVFTGDLYRDIMTAIRLGGSGIARKPTNFNLSEVRRKINTYMHGDNYLDTSAGWGIRMLGALSKGKNYYAMDVNYALVERLRALYQVITESVMFVPKCEIMINPSEVPIEQWKGKMDFLYTSPPYFAL